MGAVTDNPAISLVSHWENFRWERPGLVAEGQTALKDVAANLQRLFCFTGFHPIFSGSVTSITVILGARFLLGNLFPIEIVNFLSWSVHQLLMDPTVRQKEL